MEKSIIEILSEQIINLYDENGQEIKGTYRIGWYKSKYSSYQNESLRLFVNDEVVPKKKYRLDYKCKCGKISNILEIKYLVKNKIGCNSCRESIEKRKNQSLYIRNCFQEFGKVIKKTKKEKKYCLI